MLSPFVALFLFLFFANDEVEIISTAESAYLTDFYKDLHQNPEVSLQEEATAEKLSLELEKIGYEVTRNFGGFGVVGILKNGDGPLVFYRTDMDALPMPEKTNLPYASTKTAQGANGTTGVMHSCGHDMHMTSWVGTARYMAANSDKWSGTLMFIGQPAEEIGQGAKLSLIHI